VSALGGGAVLTPSNRERLADCDAVVWLHAEPAVLARRLAGDASRPLLAGDPLARLVALAGERESIYRSVATHDIDVAELGIDDVVARIVDIATAAASSHGDRR
jgi:shikimate kinase